MFEKEIKNLTVRAKLISLTVKEFSAIQFKASEKRKTDQRSWKC
jgi:hypothetical protein